MRHLCRTCMLVLMLMSASVVQAAPVSLPKLAKHMQYKNVKISPDGHYLAATAVVKGHTVLALIHLPDHKGHLIRPRDRDDVLNFWWASSTRVLYTVTQHQGGLDTPEATGELYGVDANGGNARMLYGYRMPHRSTGSHINHGHAEYGSAHFLSTIKGDPDHVLISVDNWEASGSAGTMSYVYRLNVRNAHKKRIATAPIREAQFVADHAGHVRFAYGKNLKGEARVFRHAADGHWQLMPQASKNRDYPWAFNADDSIAYFTCSGHGFGVCIWTPSSHKLQQIWSNPDVTPSDFVYGLARHHFIGINFTDGRPSLALFYPDSPAAKAQVALMQQFPGEDVEFVSGSRDGNKTVVWVGADTDPGQYFLYKHEANTLTPLFKAAPWIDPSRMASKQPFHFAARDGLELHGYISYPPGHKRDKQLPLVVFVHGGPYGIRDWWRYDPYVQFMATRGYAVLQVNYRGSGGYGYHFEHAGYGEWGGKMQDDVTDATRWAIRQGIADPNRICIFGGSYGGYAALEGAVKQPDLYKCTIGYVGVYDLGMMFHTADTPNTIYGKAFLKRALGTDPRILRARSPIDHVAQLKARVMLIVGGLDWRVAPAQGKDMHAALQRHHIAHTWLYKTNEGHGFYRPEDRVDLYKGVLTFLRANIGPGASAAPMKHPTPRASMH